MKVKYPAPPATGAFAVQAENARQLPAGGDKVQVAVNKLADCHFSSVVVSDDFLCSGNICFTCSKIGLDFPM